MTLGKSLAKLQNIRKAYGDCVANSDVSFEVKAGSILALLGENGAGKSTAMKILFGIEKADSGIIEIAGRKIDSSLWNPTQAFRAGLGMVHQHFMLAKTETALDNLVLGAELKRLGIFRSRRKEREALEKLMKDTQLEVPLDAKLSELPVGVQSRCEILKVLYRKPKVLILDEPTAVLTPPEVDAFLATLRRLRDSGLGILLVTHKLGEVMNVADDATVLRAGVTVAHRKITDTSPEELSELMVGRRVQLPKAKPRQKIDEGFKLGARWKDLAVGKGEILGIAGVEGNGQEALIQEILSAHSGILRQFAYIPGDRSVDGVIAPMTTAENLRLGKPQAQKNAWDVFAPPTVEEKMALQDFTVTPNEPSKKLGELSGGNQQKVAAAREIDLIAGDFLLAVNPTRGVDVGAIEVLHQKVLGFAASGKPVILISTELDELLALSHRIAVLHKGAIAAVFAGPSYSEKDIGLAMLHGESK